MSPSRRIGLRLGRRGAFLLAFGTAWAVYGCGLLSAGPTFAQSRGLTVLTRIAPIDVWSWLWIVAGLVALATAFVASPGGDTAGFVGAVLPPLAWAVAYLLAWLLGDYPRGWITAGPWAAIAVTAMIAAGTPEHIRRGGRCGP